MSYAMLLLKRTLHIFYFIFIDLIYIHFIYLHLFYIDFLNEISLLYFESEKIRFLFL